MSLTFLIVDNHPLMRKLLRDWLQLKFPECQMIQAANRGDG